MHWSRPALETKVASLEAKHSGQDFVRAVVEFADTLDKQDRRTLQDVLLQRADEASPIHLPRPGWKK